MSLQTRALQYQDLAQAAAIDRKWFGEYAISEKELSEFIEKHPENSLGIFNGETLEGFANGNVVASVIPPTI